MQANVYCAGPLFNAAEQDEMLRIASTLRGAGHKIFLPQEDGLELSELEKLCKENDALCDSSIIQSAIFHLDVYKLLGWADVVVANLNGRVPDEGTIVEAALAWHAGKGVVLYKSDARSAFSGSDNPMLTGLAGFRQTSRMSDLPEDVATSFAERSPARVKHVIALGEKIALAREQLQSHGQRDNRWLFGQLADIFRM